MIRSSYKFHKSAHAAALGMMLLAAFSGCKSNNATKSEISNETKKAASEKANANQQQDRKIAAGGFGDTNATKPGFGSIAGSVTLPDDKTGNANIFIYILDESSANFEKPVVLSSLFVQSGSAKEKKFEYFLNNVAPGLRTVTVVMDSGAPNCAKGGGFCDISLGDAAGQSEPVEVKAGGTPSRADVSLN